MHRKDGEAFDFEETICEMAALDGFSFEFFNLGLARLRGSATASVCLDVLKTRLAEFGVSLEQDVTGIVMERRL